MRINRIALVGNVLVCATALARAGSVRNGEPSGDALVVLLAGALYSSHGRGLPGGEGRVSGFGRVFESGRYWTTRTAGAGS